MPVGTGWDNRGIARNRKFLQKMHDFPTANTVVKLGMTLLRTKLPLLLLKKKSKTLQEKIRGRGKFSIPA